jgi:hypothetical protein
VIGMMKELIKRRMVFEISRGSTLGQRKRK